MKKILILIFLFTLSITAQERFVTVSGGSPFDGLSESTAWTLAQGLSNDADGMIINWKSGDYGNQNITTIASGATWIGYRVTPGDIVVSIFSDYEYGDTVDTSLYPTITGSSFSSGIAINQGQDNVHIENLQIRNIGIGILWGGNNGVVRNVVFHSFGTLGGSEVYDGFGIRVSGNFNDLDNLIVVNAAAEAITLQGDNNTVDYSKVYSDLLETENGTDYYFNISGGNNNTISNCEAVRTNESNAGRHGFVIKTSGTGNTIEECIATNVNLEAQFVAVNNNTFRDCLVRSDYSVSGDLAARLRIANGANNNYFINITFDDVYCAVSFADWDDGSVGPGNTAAEFGGGNDNYIINPIIKNSNIAIMFDEFSNLSAAEDNVIIGATIYNCNYLFRSRSQNSGTMLINSIVDNVDAFITNGSGNAILNTNTVLRNVNLTNSFNASAFTPYLESEITTLTPSFIDAASGDFRLNTTDLDIGEDPTIIQTNAGLDFNGATRTSPYRLGAYSKNLGSETITQEQKRQQQIWYNIFNQ